MVEKLDLLQFRNIKQQLLDLIRQADEDTTNTNKEELEKQIVEQYISIQNKLLSYDLRDIPFIEWEGLTILTDENIRADFSKTHANIDFSIINYYGNGNFRGCNVKNLDKIERYLNPQDFDQATIENNPNIFLSNIFSEEFQKKYYTNFIKETN